MATSTITNTIKDGSGTPIPSVTVTARLKRGFFRVSDSSEIAGYETTVSNGSGVWSLTLERQSNIVPAASYWEIVEDIPLANGGPRMWAIVVPDVNATLQTAADISFPLPSPVPDVNASQGPLADRPAGAQNQYYWTTDTHEWFRHDGTQWWEIDPGLTGLTGTFAARPAAGTVGRIYTATWPGTSIVRRYYDTGTAWASLTEPYGVFNPLDYGADPTGVADSRTAFVDCIAAANAVLDSGLPYESGNVEGGVVEVSAGQYKISSSITFPTQSQILMRGVAGSADRFLASPVIVFPTGGGFIETDSQSNRVDLERLTIISVNGVPFACEGTTATSSGPGTFRDVKLRAFTTGYAALGLKNVFGGNFHGCVFQSADSATPSVLIESDLDPGGLQGWMFRFKECIFEENGIRWDCNGAHTTVPGYGFTIQDCITENFDANVPLVHIRNTHATANFTHYGVEVIQTDHYDSADPCDIVKLETLGTGHLAVSKIHVRGCAVSGSGKHVRCVETGGGAVRPDFVLIEGSAEPAVVFGAAAGGFGVMGQASGSGWDYRGDRTTATGFRARVNGDTQDRWILGANGDLWRNSGSTAAFQTCGFLQGAGSPEGVVTAGIGSIYQRRDGGAGTSIYVKESGAGNTGWVAK